MLDLKPKVYTFSTRNILKYKNRFKVKILKKIYQASTNLQKVEVAILILKKWTFEQRILAGIKGEHFIVIKE